MLMSILFSAILFLFPFWKIYQRVGLNPPMALLVLIPFIGVMVALAVLAFSDWKINKEVV